MNPLTLKAMVWIDIFSRWGGLTRMKLTVLFSILLAFVFPASALAQWQARVVYAFDGDTLIVSREGRAEIISLFGIDCPDSEQPFGLEAKGFTSGIVTGKIIRAVSFQKGRYEMCKVFIDDKCLNEELLKAGYAWHHKKYSTDEEWARMEQNARSAGKGLWSEKNPVPPWDFKWSKRNIAREGSSRIKLPGKHKSLSSPEAIPEKPPPPATRRPKPKK
ncbi:MAG: thermonuclease family protein [Candidatus Hodarchaeota archaeon]